MRKILYIGGFELPDKNAAAQRVLAIGKTMREAGYNVEYIGVTKDKNQIGQQQEFDGFQYNSVKYPEGIKDWLYQITKFVSLEEINKRKPDVVVLYNFPAIAQNNITKYCHKKGIKVIADLTEWYVTEGKSLRDIIKRWDTKRRMTDYSYQVDGIIAISKYLFEYYNKRVKTVYIPATVDLQDEKWDRHRKILIHKPIRLVYAGSPGSGQKDKLDILVKAVMDNPKFELNVYGITKDQFIESFGGDSPTKNVRFHGRVKHLDAIKMVCESDFDVIIRDDNLVTRAGFPTKFVEAYSCGTPVIATASSNIIDYLKEGENGFVVDEHHPLGQILDKIANMNENDLIAIKEKAISLSDFDFRNYLDEVNKILS